MKRILLLSTILIFLIKSSTSCSNDDQDQPACSETEITMRVNGELQTFQALGRGISLRNNGYELHLNVDRRSNDPFREQGIAIILPYKETGENVIEQFIYHQYLNNTSFDGDFLNGDFESQVITNTRNCFHATFSGNLRIEDQEVTITEGELIFRYEEAFEE